jgi:hypothetical protein
MNNSSFPAQNPPALETRQGQCVKYVMPQGWRVTEDSQFALTLCAPDNAAMIFVGGHFSYPARYEYLIGSYVEKVISLWHPPQLEVEERHPVKLNRLLAFWLLMTTITHPLLMAFPGAESPNAVQALAIICPRFSLLLVHPIHHSGLVMLPGCHR